MKLKHEFRIMIIIIKFKIQNHDIENARLLEIADLSLDEPKLEILLFDPEENANI